jgi:hypothetical protein
MNRLVTPAVARLGPLANLVDPLMCQTLCT